jgi:hypothetical protein
MIVAMITLAFFMHSLHEVAIFILGMRIDMAYKDVMI